MTSATRRADLVQSVIDLRRLILRILLWSLAFAAVTGVLCALMASRSITGRMVWTGVITAAACVFALPCASLLEYRQFRSGALLGLITIVTCFTVGVLALWTGAIPGSLGRYADELGWTALFLGVTGIPATVAALARHHDRARLGAVILLWAQPALLLFYLSGTWLPVATQSATLDERWIVSALCGTAVVILFAVGHLGPRPVRWLAWIAAPIAYALTFGDTWGVFEVSERSFCPPWSTAVLLAYLALLFLRRLGTIGTAVRFATLGAAVALTGMVNVLVIIEPGGEFAARIALALTILVATGSVATVIFTAVARRQIVHEPADEITMRATCPRCESPLVLSPGRNHCPRCSLQIRLDLEAPRCRSCGYLLHRATGSVCPECGTPRAR